MRFKRLLFKNIFWDQASHNCDIFREYRSLNWFSNYFLRDLFELQSWIFLGISLEILWEAIWTRTANFWEYMLRNHRKYNIFSRTIIVITEDLPQFSCKYLLRTISGLVVDPFLFFLSNLKCNFMIIEAYYSKGYLSYKRERF